MINFITISAPSGSGKTTLCKALQQVEPEIEWSISYTTRKKRSIEENGVDYFFISKEEFEKMFSMASEGIKKIVEIQKSALDE